MWPLRVNRRLEIEDGLISFSREQINLPGVALERRRVTLATQMIASLRREDYTKIVIARPIDMRRADPMDMLFDPERASVIHANAGDLDEAVWLAFLATHFGKHPVHGWKRLRDVYSGLGAGRWSWQRASADVLGFRGWLRTHENQIGGGFGNHRKYESLDADTAQGTGSVVAGYVNWIGPNRSHAEKFAGLIQAGGNDPYNIFDRFYVDMRVARFGRLGKFDFLALLGRLDLAPIKPGSAYLKGATGPLRGARLLFGGSPTEDLSPRNLEEWLRQLDGTLNIGMQAMEDSLCNWQKSPDCFVHFRG